MNRTVIALTVLASLSLSIQGVAQNTAPATVLLAGAGAEPHINSLLDGLSDQLKAAGVNVKLLQIEGKSRTAAVEYLKTSGAQSLLYATADINVGPRVGMGQQDKLTLQCFDKNGTQLWEEKVSGGMMAGSADKSVKNMLKNIQKKLEPRIGQAGLPKT